MIYIQILDDDEHEPDTYFDVELYQPFTVDESKVLSPACFLEGKVESGIVHQVGKGGPLLLCSR